VSRGDFGLAAGVRRDGTYERIWYAEPVDVDEVTFEKDVFLLRKDTARALKESGAPSTVDVESRDAVIPTTEPALVSPPVPSLTNQACIISVQGDIPADVWNRLGTRLIPRLKGSGQSVSLGVTFEVTVDAAAVESLERDIRQALQDLHLGDRIRVTVR
jgi:hypothetical protein